MTYARAFARLSSLHAGLQIQFCATSSGEQLSSLSKLWGARSLKHEKFTPMNSLCKVRSNCYPDGSGLRWASLISRWALVSRP
jgi:hypothetical protein